MLRVSHALQRYIERVDVVHGCIVVTALEGTQCPAFAEGSNKSSAILSNETTLDKRQRGCGELHRPWTGSYGARNL